MSVPRASCTAPVTRRIPGPTSFRGPPAFPIGMRVSQSRGGPSCAYGAAPTKSGLQ